VKNEITISKFQRDVNDITVGFSYACEGGSHNVESVVENTACVGKTDLEICDLAYAKIKEAYEARVALIDAKSDVVGKPYLDKVARLAAKEKIELIHIVREKDKDKLQ